VFDVVYTFCKQQWQKMAKSQYFNNCKYLLIHRSIKTIGYAKTLAGVGAI